MTCPVCDSAGGFARPVGMYREARDAGSLRPVVVLESATWGAPDVCECCGGAGWLSSDDWHRWKERPRAVRLSVLNRAARARRRVAALLG
jgi:hypothetical protein